jgi:hypothetical protein
MLQIIEPSAKKTPQRPRFSERGVSQAQQRARDYNECIELQSKKSSLQRTRLVCVYRRRVFRGGDEEMLGGGVCGSAGNGALACPRPPIASKVRQFRGPAR